VKETLDLLSKLVAPGAKVVNSQGIPVAPRYPMEIASSPKVLALRKRMQPFEQERFGKLKPEY